MAFNSVDFVVFLLATFPLFLLLRGLGRTLLLLVCSIYFYAYWNPKYVALLLLSATTDYLVALAMQSSTNPRRRKLCLVISVAVNLGILAVFKYYNFFIDSLAEIGVDTGLPTSQLLLPLGVSFFTFQTMSYTIDVYRRRIEPERNPLRLLLYVSYFPQLVAGPIVRARDLLPQLVTMRGPTWTDFVEGCKRILTGLVKKVVLADNLATLVNPVFSAPESYSGPMLLIAVYAFAWQILFDFSGYSDIAIGIARTMGFSFRENFDRPYISASIQEFWRRWHMSLSSWLRDYLYIPLGGNRKGRRRTYINLLLTMLLGGLWHGPSMNFVIWGALHGSWLAAERFAQRELGLSVPTSTGSRVVRQVLLFHGVCFTWVFFRAQTFADAKHVLAGLFSLQGANLNSFRLTMVIGICGFSAGYLWLARSGQSRSWMWWLAVPLAILLLLLFGRDSQEFIYFVF